MVSLGGRLQLVGGGPQPAEGMAEVGEADAGFEQGGGRMPGTRARYTWW